MRLLNAFEMATTLANVELSKLSNAFFLDYYLEGPQNSSKLRYSSEMLHFYNAQEQQVTEFVNFKNHNNGQEDRKVFNCNLAPTNGFATVPIGDYNQLLNYTSILEFSKTPASPFLKNRPGRVEVQGLISSLFDRSSLESAEVLNWPFLSSSPESFFSPVWMSSFVETKTGASHISIYNAKSGELLFSLALTLPILPALLGPEVYASGWIYFGKFLIIVALIIALVLLWPAIAAAFAAAADAAAALGATLTFWGWLTGTGAGAGYISAILATLASFAGAVIGFFMEWGDDATDAWKQKRDLLNVKLEEAKQKAKDAEENSEWDDLRDAYEEQRDIYKELKELLKDTDSGMDEDVIKETNKFLDQMIDVMNNLLDE